jgi:hypothetical protein
LVPVEFPQDMFKAAPREDWSLPPSSIGECGHRGCTGVALAKSSGAADSLLYVTHV